MGRVDRMAGSPQGMLPAAVAGLEMTEVSP